MYKRFIYFCAVDTNFVTLYSKFLPLGSVCELVVGLNTENEIAAADFMYHQTASRAAVEFMYQTASRAAVERIYQTASRAAVEQIIRLLLVQL
jgi:hypothetical protein